MHMFKVFPPYLCVSLSGTVFERRSNRISQSQSSTCPTFTHSWFLASFSLLSVFSVQSRSLTFTLQIERGQARRPCPLFLIYIFESATCLPVGSITYSSTYIEKPEKGVLMFVCLYLSLSHSSCLLGSSHLCCFFFSKASF